MAPIKHRFRLIVPFIILAGGMLVSQLVSPKNHLKTFAKDKISKIANFGHTNCTNC